MGGVQLAIFFTGATGTKWREIRHKSYWENWHVGASVGDPEPFYIQASQIVYFDLFIHEHLAYMKY